MPWQLHLRRRQQAELELPRLVELALDAPEELLTLLAEPAELEAAVHQRRAARGGRTASG